MSKFLTATAGMTKGPWLLNKNGNCIITKTDPFVIKHPDHEHVQFYGGLKIATLDYPNHDAVALTAAAYTPEMYETMQRHIANCPCKSQFSKTEWCDSCDEMRDLLAKLDALPQNGGK